MGLLSGRLLSLAVTSAFSTSILKRINYTGILRGKCTIQKAHVYQNISFILVAFLTQRNRSGMLKTCVSGVSKTVV